MSVPSLPLFRVWCVSRRGSVFHSYKPTFLVFKPLPTSNWCIGISRAQPFTLKSLQLFFTVSSSLYCIASPPFPPNPNSLSRSSPFLNTTGIVSGFHLRGCLPRVFFFPQFYGTIFFFYLTLYLEPSFHRKCGIDIL